MADAFTSLVAAFINAESAVELVKKHKLPGALTFLEYNLAQMLEDLKGLIDSQDAGTRKTVYSAIEEVRNRVEASSQPRPPMTSKKTRHLKLVVSEEETPQAPE